MEGNKETAVVGTPRLDSFQAAGVHRSFQGLGSQLSPLQDVGNSLWVSLRLLFSFSLWLNRHFSETLCETASGSK